MPEFTASIDIFLPTNQTFEYISDVARLPSYARIITHAEPQPLGDRMQIRGDADGRPFETGGEWRVDRKAMRVEWTVDINPDHGGSLSVSRGGQNCRVDAMVRFRVWTQDMLKHHGEREWETIVQHHVDGALHALKELLERGGPGAMSEASRAG